MKIERSAKITAAGIGALFLLSVVAVLISPHLTENSWVDPVCSYQKQMYEVADPNVYLTTATTGSQQIHTLYHLHDKSLPLAFIEQENEAIFSEESLRPYITSPGMPIRLTHRLLLLKEMDLSENSALVEKAKRWKERQEAKSTERVRAFLLYDPGVDSTFTVADSDGITENWVDEGDFIYLDREAREIAMSGQEGTIYARNPKQYRLAPYSMPSGDIGWKYDPFGEVIASSLDLQTRKLGAMTRAQLISFGETIVAAEGCNTCHTFQNRTLIQDSVLNGLDHPAPPSAPGEYIYERVSFMGTKRNGPDLSRVGVKRMSRDWHMSHFWSPKTASPGSIMPSYRHFFDFALSGTEPNETGIPSYRFEAVYQYLMTKGTRLSSPNRAWWRGGDPRVRDLLEGKKK